MTSDRSKRMIRRLLEQAGGPDASLEWLCDTCAGELEVSGAAVALIVSGHDPGSIASSDEVASAVVDLQFRAGEGPAIDAHRGGLAVIEPELATSARWPVLGPEALAAGAEALFAFPLQAGAARFGALTLYRDRPGPLGDGIFAAAQTMAEVACEIALRLQAQVPPGSLHQVLEHLGDQRTVIYQATGMVMVQLGVDPEGAGAALRARAYVTGRPVRDVAADVVARRIRFEQ